MTDPIIDELHRFREEALAEVGFDHHLFCERVRERERQSQRVVEPPLRMPPTQAAAAERKPPLRSGSRR
jgi:hypothetical protein